MLLRFSGLSGNLELGRHARRVNTPMPTPSISICLAMPSGSFCCLVSMAPLGRRITRKSLLSLSEPVAYSNLK